MDDKVSEYINTLSPKNLYSSLPLKFSFKHIIFLYFMEFIESFVPVGFNIQKFLSN